MENESFSTLLAQIYQDLVENFDLNNRLERFKIFAANHPFLTLFGIFTVVLCSIPVACFVGFTLFSIFLTFGGFMFLEGTVLTFATIILGGVLIIMGVLSIAFSLSVAVGLFLFHKGLDFYRRFHNQFLAVVGREVDNLRRQAAAANVNANARPQPNQTTPSSPPYTPSSPPSTRSTPSPNTNSPSSIGHTATSPISLQSPPAPPVSASAPSPPSPSEPVGVPAATSTHLPSTQVMAQVAPIVQSTTGVVQVTSVDTTQQTDSLVPPVCDAQTSPVSSGQSPEEVSTETSVLLAGAIPARTISDGTHLRHRVSPTSSVTTPESDDRTLRATTAPPTLTSVSAMSSQDSSSVEACAHSSTSRDSSDVLNWESSSSSTSSLNPGDQWEVLPTQTEKLHYATDHHTED